MKILVFDNYDSFTYNLVHLVKKINDVKIDVFRNDEIELKDVNKYDKIILSPGPGIPEEAGLLLPLIKEYASKKSILGVCLGHQAIGEAFGGKLINLETVYHGVAMPIKIGVENPESKGGSRKSGVGPKDSGLLRRSRNLFNGMPNVINVGRYHSWIVSDEDFPEVLEVTARDENGYIMALQHKEYDIQGVQFHPESVLTPDGETIIRNWLGA